MVLIPGAGGQAWVWHLVEADLRRRGYDAFAVDLPAADESKGLPAYADAVVSAINDRAIGDRTPVTIAAYSLGAFTAPLVWQRVPAQQVIFVNAMIPRPGERAGDWWGNTGAAPAREAAALRHGYSPEFGLDEYFLQAALEIVDTPGLRAFVVQNEVKTLMAAFAFQKVTGNALNYALSGHYQWENQPGNQDRLEMDRFFPVELQQRVARERLGVEPDVVPGGHLAALSRPADLAAALARYL